MQGVICAALSQTGKVGFVGAMEITPILNGRTGFEQGEHTVYHRLYDVANITVISNKNTVGVYDMESEVEAVLKPAGSGNSETGNA